MKKNILNKEQASLILTECPSERKFICLDGKELSTLKELSIHLLDMSKESFDQHLNSQKNDFHNWILFVFRDEELAKSIAKETSKENISKKISKRLKELSKISK
jgi:hypothetical protein